ncbi:MAG TPA: hypothetical protein VFE47_18910 [Tepidisphaeraceae bacterium]|nr:hypothetical protein [Tepidisphaeraceae bacterium]
MIHTFARRWTICFRSTIPGLCVAMLMLPSLSGCAIFSQVLGAAAPTVHPAAYKHMADQSVTVMVWADDGVKIDNPRIQFDVEQMVMAKMQEAQKTNKPDELKLTRFPVSAGSVSRFQEEHTELVADPIDEIAPRFGTSRVIYVEIHSFQTRSEASNDLFRGVMKGSVQVVEVTHGKGKVVPVDDNLEIKFPRTSPEEGLPNIGDYAIYNGTLDGFATEVAKLFAPHADDPDAPYAARTSSTASESAGS